MGTAPLRDRRSPRSSWNRRSRCRLHAASETMSSPELPDTESHPFDVKAITAAVYIGCFVLACIFVKGTTVCGEDGWCITSTAPYRFRFIIPIFPALFTWLAMRRWLEGPEVQRDDLVVFFS